MTRRIVQAIELADDPTLIAEYEAAHRVGNVPPQVVASQRRHGIVAMDIYRLGPRLVMVMEVSDAFDPGRLDAEALADPAIAFWHQRMNRLQRSIGGGTAWTEMVRVFSQDEQP